MIIADDLKTFLNKIEEFTSSRLIQNKTLVSLVFALDKIDFPTLLNNIQHREETYFYSTRIHEGIAFLGFDSIFKTEAYGDNRLEITESETKNLEKNFVNNWNEFNLTTVPLFLGGMKFSVSSQDNLWKDYSDSDWFIPKFLFLKLEKKTFLIYNFFGSHFFNKKIADDFELLNKLLEKNKLTEPKKSKIVSTSNGRDKSTWIKNVNSALKEIEENRVQKIVLSREVDIELDTTADIAFLLTQLEKRYPRCYVFAYRKSNSIFFGASPEKLAKISAGWIEADALAGSISRGKTEEEDLSLANTLLSSKKDLAEQEIVVSFINNSFNKFCDKIIYNENPVIRKLPNIQHLWTPIKGKIKQQQSVFSILKELHPTPAICGVPWDKARESIIEMEIHNRGLFTGMIGWFNFYNEGEFAVAIRSALMRKKSVYAFAGCGIVKGSNPEIEYEESELKLRPIISLFETIK